MNVLVYWESSVFARNMEIKEKKSPILCIFYESSKVKCYPERDLSAPNKMKVKVHRIDRCRDAYKNSKYFP